MYKTVSNEHGKLIWYIYMTKQQQKCFQTFFCGCRYYYICIKNPENTHRLWYHTQYYWSVRTLPMNMYMHFQRKRLWCWSWKYITKIYSWNKLFFPGLNELMSNIIKLNKTLTNNRKDLVEIRGAGVWIARTGQFRRNWAWKLSC